MEYSRRACMGAMATLASTGLAGCATSPPTRFLLVTAFNLTEQARTLSIRISDGGSRLVRQHLQLPPGNSGEAADAQTEIALEGVSEGAELDVEAAVDDGPTTSRPLTLDCPDERAGSALTVRILGPEDVRLSDDRSANQCYDVEDSEFVG